MVVKRDVVHEAYLLNWRLVNVDGVESSPNNIAYEDSFCVTFTWALLWELLIPVISEHWTDLGAANWLLLLTYGMSSQLIWFYRERLLGGAPYWKMCSVVYVLDLYHMYVYEVYYSKKQSR